VSRCVMYRPAQGNSVGFIRRAARGAWHRRPPT
jgi:hypothetical protein